MVTAIELAALDDLYGLSNFVALCTDAFGHLDTSQGDLRRAAEVQLTLANQGYRLPSSSLLVVAAVAERHRVAVLHDNAAFELIAQITGQKVERVTSGEGVHP
jgi:predicted nucleic acid-binding protein